jgi:hypothetical protein
MNRPRAATSPITALSEKARTLTSTDSAPSLMSSAPAMMSMIQIMVILLCDGLVLGKKSPQGCMPRGYLTGYKKNGAFEGAGKVFQWRGANPSPNQIILVGCFMRYTPVPAPCAPVWSSQPESQFSVTVTNVTFVIVPAVWCSPFNNFLSPVARHI